MKQLMIVLLMVILFGILPVQAQSVCPVTTAVNFALVDYGNGFTAVQTAAPVGVFPVQRQIVYAVPVEDRPIASVSFDFRVNWLSMGSERTYFVAAPFVDCDQPSSRFSWTGQPHYIYTDVVGDKGVWFHTTYPWIQQSISDRRGYDNPPSDQMLYIAVYLTGYNENTSITGLQIDVRNITVTYG